MAMVDFFFGPGSRYSYLAATQLGSLAARTGATFRWRAVFSGDLIARTGGANPFTAAALRGQYDPGYRARDATRWAAHYGVPYCEPSSDGVDWPLIALWCAGAELLSDGYGEWALRESFQRGKPPTSPDQLLVGAATLGLSPQSLAEIVATGRAAARRAQNLSDAIAAGAFGVPTFVCQDGELFWGQDRIPLLIDHLSRGAAR